jgi:peptidoglycan/LPS O-acetylase OafA/YrhL
LQSLRGIAALIVAVSHLSSIYVLPPTARIAIDAVCNAHGCIIVFFELGGYVLTGSLVRRGLSWPSIRAFYVEAVPAIFCTLGCQRDLSFISIAVPAPDDPPRS